MPLPILELRMRHSNERLPPAFVASSASRQPSRRAHAAASLQSPPRQPRARMAALLKGPPIGVAATGKAAKMALMVALPPPVQCVLQQSTAQTAKYLRSVYGSAPSAEMLLSWHWKTVDVIWLPLLDARVRECILHHRSSGRWTAHSASGLYLPPIGSKMELPLIWQYRSELGCAGSKAEMGGTRGPPREQLDGGWVEVVHYMRRSEFERHNVWMYRATGSGVWYHMGKTLLFSDLADLATYLRDTTSDSTAALWLQVMERGTVSSNDARRHKLKLIARATALLRRKYDTIAFTSHVDAGFSAKGMTCRRPGPGWDFTYFSLFELLDLRPTATESHGTSCRSLPPFRAGWPGRLRSCMCSTGRFRPSESEKAHWNSPPVSCAV